VQNGLRAALARPGAAWQRALRRVTRIAIYGLPAAALLAISMQVVGGYYRATVGEAPFLGQEFAIHSVLLVLVAWGLPFAFDRMLKPSIERSAMRGMKEGLDAALAELGERLRGGLGEAVAASAQQRESAERLIRDIASVELHPLEFRGESLPRVIANPRLARAG
jgi:hypothetical protein